MKKYKTGKYDLRIEEVEYVRETAKKLYVMQPAWRLKGPDKMEVRAVSKVSEYAQYHDSWEAAHAFLMERTKTRLEYVRASLQRAQDEHGNVKGMKPPAFTK